MFRKLRVWEKIGDKFDWEYPDFQTYGASNNKIRMSLLGIRQTIPSCAYDGGKEIDDLINDYNKGF